MQEYYDLQLPKRPRLCTDGELIKVTSNSFKIITDADFVIYRYKFSIEPQTGKYQSRTLFNQWKKMYSNFQNPEEYICFDGSATIYSAARIQIDQNSFLCPLDDQKKRKRNEKLYKIMVSYLGPVDDVAHVCDLVFRQSVFQIMNQFSRVAHDARFAKKVSDGVFLVPGYQHATRSTEQGLFLLLRCVGTLLLEEKPLSQFLQDCFPKIQQKDYKQILMGLQRVKFKAMGKIRYLTKFSKYCSGKQLMNVGSVSMSVLDYYAKYMNLTINPNLLCAAYDLDEYIPLECMQICAGQRPPRFLGKLDTSWFQPGDTKPDKQAQNITSSIRALFDPKPNLFRNFKLNLDLEMTKIDARKLFPPQLLFHKDSKTKTETPKLASWNWDEHKVVKGAYVKRWVVLPLLTNQSNEILNFMKRLMFKMKDLGIKTKDFKLMLPCDPQNLELGLQHAYLEAGNHKKHPDLIVCFIKKKNTALYMKIKQICETRLGVCSQIITMDVCTKYKEKHLINIALKLNVKLKGVNQITDLNECTMFMAADVTHPSWQHTTPSIAAVSASIDLYGATYASSTRIQPKHTEIILDMGSMVFDLLNCFFKEQKKYPEKIIFYRDGVSEGEFLEVLRSEVESIRRVFKKLLISPRIDVIVVQKRHHVRFFSELMEPGVCVDHTVNSMYDFYLQSHYGSRGLSKPTRYTVILNENNLNLIELTHKLCFLFPRGSKAVSMPAPCFYAHVCAARAKCYLEQNNNDFSLFMVRPGLKGMYFI